MAKSVGISPEKLYSWYFKGKNGDEKYMEFSKIFELGVIIPRLIAFNKASDLGVSQKGLIKKLKKDIGSVDFKIWQKHGIFDLDDTKIKIDGDDDIDDESLYLMLKQTGFLNFNKKGSKSKDVESIEVSYSPYESKPSIKNIIKAKIVGK